MRGRDREPRRASTSAAFTVTGGTGIYAGASGTGTVTRSLALTHYGSFGKRDVDRHPHCAGPGLRRDAADTGGSDQPDGANQEGCEIGPVAFEVTAKDDRDGTLPVACTRKSGSLFKLGMTRVTCSSSDSSANAAKASFSVTVRPTT